jgi:hypothetical protein
MISHLPDRIHGWVRTFMILPLLVLTAPGAWADYVDEWGPAVGSRIPALEVSDQDGKQRTLADLSGESGLLLFLNRSADW